MQASQNEAGGEGSARSLTELEEVIGYSERSIGHWSCRRKGKGKGGLAHPAEAVWRSRWHAQPSLRVALTLRTGAVARDGRA